MSKRILVVEDHAQRRRMVRRRSLLSQNNGPISS
jgi:hypothetical protein